VVKLVWQGCWQLKSLDVKELDAASNRSIDDIRALKDDIRHNPIDCRMKYVIIDEAHSLTGQAAEAALKMIEEPPKHVRFILATTDPHKLKETIHSRCITFKFFSVPWSVLAKHLTTIADKEGLKYEPDALKLAARAASGSVRNALQNLQTLLNYVGEGEITVDAAKAMLGAVDEVLYFNFMKSIMETQATTGIQIVENLLKDGRNADDVVNGLYAHLRNLMVAKTCREQMSDFGFTEDEVKRFQHQANAMGLALILELMGMLADVSRGLIFNLDPQTLLDKYVIDAIVAYRMKMQREQQ